MALKDDLEFTPVTNEDYVLLLDGEGIITNMSNFNQNLKFRLDTVQPNKTVASRTLYGDDRNKLSFENTRADTKVYGIAASDKYVVQVLVTRDVV
ncbi:MAG: hypothetical protein C0625_01635 [Arcobacter sp.]|nr:MAG: hypothetical protein C0625_01635 [Arcobacter sp.]